jgi:hypothetical protein
MSDMTESEANGKGAAAKRGYVCLIQSPKDGEIIMC